MENREVWKTLHEALSIDEDWDFFNCPSDEDGEDNFHTADNTRPMLMITTAAAVFGWQQVYEIQFKQSELRIFFDADCDNIGEYSYKLFSKFENDGGELKITLTDGTILHILAFKD